MFCRNISSIRNQQSVPTGTLLPKRVEQKDAAGHTLRIHGTARSDDTRPCLAAAEDFGPSVPTGTLLRIGSCDPPGERAVRDKNPLVEMFLQELSVPLGRLRAVKCKT